MDNIENIKVEEKCSDMRAVARAGLKGHWWEIFLGVLIYMLFMGGVVFAFGLVTNWDDPVRIINGGNGFSGLYELLLSGAFEFGFVYFMISFFRLKNIKYDNLFSGFQVFGKTVGIHVLTTFFTFMWSLLFIIPGIIAAYRYSQAYYILADDPSKNVYECIRESSIKMVGNKWKLFSLQFSFIGWLIVASIPMGILNYFTLRIAFSTDVDYIAANGTMISGVTLTIGIGLYLVLLLLTFIPYILVTEYIATSNVVFYELLSGHLRPVGRDGFRPEYTNSQYTNSEYNSSEYTGWGNAGNSGDSEIGDSVKGVTDNSVNGGTGNSVNDDTKSDSAENQDVNNAENKGINNSDNSGNDENVDQ